jgi:hypothetical protein
MPTVTDRLVQAAQIAFKLVLEPIFEANFMPVSSGFRRRRRAYEPATLFNAPRTGTVAHLPYSP